MNEPNYGNGYDQQQQYGGGYDQQQRSPYAPAPAYAGGGGYGGGGYDQQSGGYGGGGDLNAYAAPAGDEPQRL